MAIEQAGPARVVSSEDEALILVDEHDQEVGVLSKGQAHDGDGILHRAFSVFLFDSKGRLLIQQRADGKRLWPLFWANSCCSHPRAGETLEYATQRRLSEELGVTTELEFVYKFKYQAQYLDLGSEHELCSVFVGRVDPAQVRPNPSEVAAWRFVTPEQVDQMLSKPDGMITPWFRMEWGELRGELPVLLNNVA
ncbi:MAG: isopentenyl-diphosphate Delta-isomerase [Pseudomonadota bacterium]